MSVNPNLPVSRLSTATSAVRAHGEIAELLVLNLPRRIPGGAPDHVVHGHAHGEEFIHDVEHVLHAGIHAADVQVRGDGIGEKALFERGHGDAPGETAAAMAHVEDDAALAPFDHSRIELAGFVEFMAQAGIAVRVDVAGAQFFGQQFGRWGAPAGRSRNRPSPEFWRWCRLRRRAPPGSTRVRRSGPF